MIIVLFRHAEKQNNPGGNPTLSERGHKQALSLLQDIEKGELPHPSKIISSPKIRTQQTLQPIANFYSLDLQIDPLLDERHSGESIEIFQKRINKALHTTKNNPAYYFLSLILIGSKKLYPSCIAIPISTSPVSYRGAPLSILSSKFTMDCGNLKKCEVHHGHKKYLGRRPQLCRTC